MAAFAAGTYRPSPGRGTSPGFRFTLYAVVAILLMFIDQRHGWLEEARYLLSAAAYPLQLAVSSPTAAWRWMVGILETRAALRSENAALRAHERELELQTLRFEALARENGELRGLRAALPPVADRWLVAEIVNVELDNLRQRVLINRGARNGVFKGQAVLDSHGLLGQTIHVGPWSAQVILITDPEHEVPVQLARTGVRTIAVGTGDPGTLALPYLPVNADVQPGDLLVTSGLGGVFPQGYPVARVIEVHRDAIQPLAQIRAKPLAQLDKLREVMVVWFRADHPAAPSGLLQGNGPESDLGVGSAAFQPQSIAGAGSGSPPSLSGASAAAAKPAPAPAHPGAAAAAGSRAKTSAALAPGRHAAQKSSASSQSSSKPPVLPSARLQTPPTAEPPP